jgi:hypothetical protein
MTAVGPVRDTRRVGRNVRNRGAAAAHRRQAMDRMRPVPPTRVQRKQTFAAMSLDAIWRRVDRPYNAMTETRYPITESPRQHAAAAIAGW